MAHQQSAQPLPGIIRLYLDNYRIINFDTDACMLAFVFFFEKFWQGLSKKVSGIRYICRRKIVGGGRDKPR